MGGCVVVSKMMLEMGRGAIVKGHTILLGILTSIPPTHNILHPSSHMMSLDKWWSVISHRTVINEEKEHTQPNPYPPQQSSSRQ